VSPPSAPPGGAAPNAETMCGLVHRPDPFVAALAGDPSLERVVRGINTIVDASFQAHPMRGGSKAVSPEWRRRMLWCVALFRELQGDLKWTTDRALSMLRPALAAHLDGRPSPVTRRGEGRALWVPDSALAAAGAIRVDDVALAPPGPADGVESLEELVPRLQLDDGDD
jgi:hypothetical protein